MLQRFLGVFHRLLAHPVALSGRNARWVAVCLLCLGCALSALACVNEEVRVIDDPFTGRTRTFIVSLPGGGYQGLQSVSVTEARGRYALEVMVMSWGDSSAVARMGDPAEFAVGAEVLTLTSSGEARPVANVFGGRNGPIYTQWRIPFALDAAMVSRFAAAPLRAFKVRVGGQDLQVSLASWKAEKFRDNMAILTPR
jgi:hypothetical protein